MSFFQRGGIYKTSKLKTHFGIEAGIKPKYTNQVLLLDVTHKDVDYTEAMAVDSLSNMGWVRYDEIKEVLGEKAAMKVMKRVTDKIRVEAAKQEGNINGGVKGFGEEIVKKARKKK